MSEFHKILQRKFKEHPETSVYESWVSEDGTLYLQNNSERHPFVSIGSSFIPIWTQGHNTPADAVDAIFTLANEHKRFAEAYREAPPLHGQDEYPREDDSGYRILSEHGNTVMAALLRGDGKYTCTTWEYDSSNKNYRINGRYHMNNYKEACLDFSIRAGLVPETMLIRHRDAEIILQALDALESLEYKTMTDQQYKALNTVSERIKETYPNIAYTPSEQEEQLESPETQDWGPAISDLEPQM